MSSTAKSVLVRYSSESTRVLYGYRHRSVGEELNGVIGLET